MSARQLLFDVTPGACFSVPSAKEKCGSPDAPSDMAQQRFLMSNKCKVAKAAHCHLLSSSQLLLLGWISETNFIAGGNKSPQWSRTRVSYQTLVDNQVLTIRDPGRGSPPRHRQRLPPGSRWTVLSGSKTSMSGSPNMQSFSNFLSSNTWNFQTSSQHLVSYNCTFQHLL